MRLDMTAAKAYFEQESLIQELNSMEFDIGIGGLNYADALLFRALEIDYITLTEEDIEVFTM